MGYGEMNGKEKKQQEQVANNTDWLNEGTIFSAPHSYRET